MAKPDSAQTPPTRLLSLDVLRGLTLAFMIMVNNKGGPGAWPQMLHAEWNGFTATDLVFPTFLFVVGVSIVFSIQARLKRGESRQNLALHALVRAVILFLFGIVVNNFPDFRFDDMRFYGVLQRIAVCYLIVSLFYLWDRHVWTKVALLFFVLMGYWILVRWVPVPGAGVPGRDIQFLDKNQNIVAWVDRQLMPGHLYEDPPLHDARDPEGLLSDIPAIGTTLLGLLAGLWLRGQRAIKTKTLGLAAGAAACLASGYFWSIWFPLNKKMWTSSYVLVAAGWSLLLFAMFYWAMEQRGWGKAGLPKRLLWPCLVLGSNAIVAYMISELLSSVVGLVPFTSGGHRTDALQYIYVHLFMGISDIGWRAFLYSLSYTALCFVPVLWLYRKRIFVKI
ncbi:MAG TPA: heparan-alpha-glucosaminide N-acetyltransferase domain-containing protein [Terracidiphilus sp.]|jgi:predicted acyltransferase